MSQIFCQKLKAQKTQLKHQPLPGKMGAYLYQHISQEGWQQWLIQQTKLINEYRLDPMSEKTQLFLKSEMLTYLFGSDKINIE